MQEDFSPSTASSTAVVWLPWTIHTIMYCEAVSNAEQETRDNSQELGNDQGIIRVGVQVGGGGEEVGGDREHQDGVEDHMQQEELGRPHRCQYH